MLTIRSAELTDLPEILNIYNDIIATSTAVYALEPVTLQNRRRWYDDRTSAGYPILVATTDDVIRGFSTFGEWRAWPGYRYTVEHSVHVRDEDRGQGIGHQLVEALFPLARAQQKHVMVGSIDAANTASIRFHERLGFKHVAHFYEVGHKFGHWLDLVLMQRWIDTPGAPRS